MKEIYLFSGAGNNFVVIDGRSGGADEFRRIGRIVELCREYHTDGLMILSTPGPEDFTMEFFNPDGSGGMMCGNGGRCIVAFADYLGLRPAAADGTWHFLAPDGPHTATILQCPEGDSASGGGIPLWTVRLKMTDVHGITPIMGGYFLNTGTRHFVKFVQDVDSIDIGREAKPIRWDKAFQPEGTNVNYVQQTPDGLKVRTFEKGVEGETLACGTGITASAIAACFAQIPGYAVDGVTSTRGISYRLQCRRGDWLTVEFNAAATDFTEVYLTGPAEKMP